jgi:hypothetical protein
VIFPKDVQSDNSVCLYHAQHLATPRNKFLMQPA